MGDIKTETEESELDEPVTLALTDPTVGVGTLASVVPSVPSAAALSCANPTDGVSALKTV